MCSRVVISGAVGGSGNPSWNAKRLVIFKGHLDYKSQMLHLQTHVLLIGSLLGTTSSSLPLFSHSLHF